MGYPLCMCVYICVCVCVCVYVRACAHCFWFCLISSESALEPLGSGLSAQLSAPWSSAKTKPSKAQPIAGRTCGKICTISANQGDRKASLRGPRVIRLRHSRTEWGGKGYSHHYPFTQQCVCVCVRVCMFLYKTCRCMGSSSVSVFVCGPFRSSALFSVTGGEDKHDRRKRNKKEHIRLPRCVLQLPTAQGSGIFQTAPPCSRLSLSSPEWASCAGPLWGYPFFRITHRLTSTDPCRTPAPVQNIQALPLRGDRWVVARMWRREGTSGEGVRMEGSIAQCDLSHLSQAALDPARGQLCPLDRNLAGRRLQ